MRKNNMKTPILESERLMLRPFQADDAVNVFACWESDPDVAKYMFWTSHNDIEFDRPEEDLILAFLDDTADCYISEHIG